MKNNNPLQKWVKAEPIVLGSIFVIVCCLWGFLRLATKIMGQQDLYYDQKILLSMRQSIDLAEPIGPLFLKDAMVDLSALGSVSVALVIFVTVLGLLLIQRQHRLVIFMTLSIFGGSALSIFLKTLFMRSRPDLIPHLTPAHYYSFPSGHSMTATVVYFTLAMVLSEAAHEKIIKHYILICAILIIGIVGISRVYIGVHWPSDVLGGWMMGTAWALLCWLIQRSTKKK